MRRLYRINRHVVLLLCLICLSSCKTSDDASAAAKQLAATATDLANYYATLSQVTTATITLGGLQNTLLPHGDVLPFSDANRALSNTTLAEIQKRSDLAKTLEDVSTAFSNLIGSTAPTDVSNAASKLGSELTTLKALPSPSGSPISIPSAIDDAGKLIVSLIQQHEERKAAPGLDATANALKELFAKEQEAGAYDSLYHTYLTKAASLAKYSIEKNWVDETSVLGPALQPFGLTGKLNSKSDAAPLQAAAEAEIDETTQTLDAAHQKASAAMLQAITDMGTRMHQLATEDRMPSRGAPVTLTTVENWINTVSTSLPASTTTAPAAGASSTTAPSAKKSKK